MARHAKRNQLIVLSNEAFKRKQDAWLELDKAWKRLQRVRGINGPLIKELRQKDRLVQTNLVYKNLPSTSEIDLDNYTKPSYSPTNDKKRPITPELADQYDILVSEICSAANRHTVKRDLFIKARDRFDKIEDERLGHNNKKLQIGEVRSQTS